MRRANYEDNRPMRKRFQTLAIAHGFAHAGLLKGGVA
jgi:hypothetical protein